MRIPTNIRGIHKTENYIFNTFLMTLCYKSRTTSRKYVT